MFTKQQRKLINYETITIYEKNYQLPVLKNTGLKTIQTKIKERQRLIREGVRYRYQLGGMIKRKEEITQAEIFDEIQLFIKDYSQLIDFLENYKDSYHIFLSKLTDELKKIFKQKYLEIKNIESERIKIEIKNQNNQKILDGLRWEKQENFKAVFLLSNAYFLMIEKIKLLGEGIKKLSTDSSKQKKILQQIVKDLEVYQEIYEYQRKAHRLRQEIAKLSHAAVNFETSLQDYFSPFQSLIDEVVRADEYFYATVWDIKSLGDDILQYKSSLLSIQETNTISETFVDFMVTSYEKKARLKDAFAESQLQDWQIYDIHLSDNRISLEKSINLISNYISKQLSDQGKPLDIGQANYISTAPLSSVQHTGLIKQSDSSLTFAKEFCSNHSADYTELENLLAQHLWKEADIETTKLMLQVMKKSHWNEVYKEDIENFCCKDLQIIDQLWEQYSYGYFGFSVQQSIWSEIGGQIDYETEKKLGDRLGWRKDGNWLEYEQLTFKLSPMIPMGHLPVNWLHYDSTNSSPKLSTENVSMAAWRVGSWLVWQMHLFFSRTRICNGISTP